MTKVLSLLLEAVLFVSTFSTAATSGYVFYDSAFTRDRSARCGGVGS